MCRTGVGLCVFQFWIVADARLCILQLVAGIVIVMLVSSYFDGIICDTMCANKAEFLRSSGHQK